MMNFILNNKFILEILKYWKQTNMLSKILAATSVIYTAQSNMQVLEINDKITEINGTLPVIPSVLPEEIGLDIITKDDELKKRDPDFNKTFLEIVAENGFIFEQHPVTTEDGYILNVFRIRSTETKEGAPVVFFQHGVVDSADCWIMNYPEVAPAFKAVRAGYDVWLGNQRGTKYSMNHKTLSNKSKEYWSFSFTEMGKYDAPAQIELALRMTGNKKVTYVGHSQGTTQMFYALQAEPEYWGQKVNLFVAAAPVTRLDHTTNPLIKLFAQIQGTLRNTLYFFKVYSLLGDAVTSAGVHLVCGTIPSLCQFLEGFAITHDPSLDDEDRF